MQSQRLWKSVTTTVLSLIFAASLAGYAAAAEDYSFKIHNGTKSTIKKVMVSEDKKEWGEFDVGSGLAPGSTTKLVWGKNTNNEECKQYVKAVYADGSEAEPSKFDFCEKDLVIEFSE